MELPLGKKTSFQNPPKRVLLLLLTIIPIYCTLLSPFAWKDFASSIILSQSSSSTPCPSNADNSTKTTRFYNNSSPLTSPSSSSSEPPPLISSPTNNDVNKSTIPITRLDEKCDIFKGKWVRDPNAPYYTNLSCWFIADQQNCLKFGRPDTDFMKWRWQPDGCDLPIFEPVQFLEHVRGKSMAFVGDSVGRNQMQSLICLLSRAENPIDVSYTRDDKFKRWVYASYNFTLASFWSPFLIRFEEVNPTVDRFSGHTNLYLDESDEKWTSQIDEFDYVMFSAGHWFFRALIFREGGRIVGCNACGDDKIKDLTMYYGYQKAFRTAFDVINGRDRFNGRVFLRTFSPAHFENGPWNEGGNCTRTRPFMRNETRLEGYNLELYKTQVGEFRRAENEGRKRGLKYRLMDVTEAMWLRPDGHPNKYGHSPDLQAHNDCVHWCMPGPIDVWNDILLQMMKMDGGGSSD